MNSIVSRVFPFLFAVFLLSSCAKEEPLVVHPINLSGASIHDAPNRIDTFIAENFTKPYNMRIVYKWDDKEFDQSKNLVPVDTAFVIPVLTLLKDAWLDNYAKYTVNGEEFLKKYAPKLIVISGGKNYNQDGTFTQGVAEAARKVTLFQANEYYNKNPETQSYDILERYLHIVEHEFSHVLHQSNLYDIKAYTAVTPGVYRSDWYNFKDRGVRREKGVITAYGMAARDEDFAEMVSTMLTNSRERYRDSVLGPVEMDTIAAPRIVGTRVFRKSDLSSEIYRYDGEVWKSLPTPEDFRDYITPTSLEQLRKKEKIIVDYFRDMYGIDFYELQEATSSSLRDIISKLP